MPSSTSKESLNLTLVGETASGKTTLLNSLANYSQYPTLDEAIGNGPIVLADVGFAYNVPDGNRTSVYVKGSVQNGGEQINGSGVTRTENCSFYTINTDESSNVKLYDAPGFGSQSPNQVNCARRPTHALCVVLKADETRLNSEIRSFLEKEGKAFSKNIVYCFTYGRVHLPSAATLSLLREFLLDLEGLLGVEFPTRKENIFCFENDCFRYLCYLSKSSGDKGRHHKKFSIEWKRNVKEYERLISYVKSLNPVLKEEDPETNSVPNLLEDESSESSNKSESGDSSEKSDEEEEPADEPKTIYILLLGEAGVGKSTFSNAIANYLKYKKIHEARANGPEVLIKTVFTQLDEDLNPLRVECDPTILGPDNRNDNEDEKTGTKMPQGHTIKWGQTTICLIDTPPILSVQGVEKDRENLTNILDFLAHYPKIHGILVLLKSNISHIAISFNYVINEILSHLHVSAKENIMFCCTNGRQTFYEPGETVSKLRYLLDCLETERGIRIPLERHNTFCFDNDSFRFLCADSKGCPVSVEKFKLSWNKSAKETLRLLNRIKKLKPHRVQETLSLAHVRSLAFKLTSPLTEMLHLIEFHRKRLESKAVELATLEKEKHDLEQLDDFVKQTSVHARELGHPVLACAGENCIEMVKLNDHPTEIERIKYRRNCEDPCYLTGVMAGSFPNQLIKNAACFDFGSHPERCNTCTCDWKTHMIIHHELVITVVNPKKTELLKNNENEREAVEMLLSTERKELKKLEEQANNIKCYFSDVANNLRANSILLYNDIYVKYVDYVDYVEDVIGEQDERIKNEASHREPSRLVRYRKQYEQFVKLLHDVQNSQSSPKTMEEIIITSTAIGPLGLFELLFRSSRSDSLP